MFEVFFREAPKLSFARFRALAQLASYGSFSLAVAVVERSVVHLAAVVRVFVSLKRRARRRSPVPVFAIVSAAGGYF